VRCFYIEFRTHDSGFRLSPTAVVILLGALTCLPSIAQTATPASSNFARLSTQADAARDANHLDEAVVLYGKALALRPKWAEGWWSLGTIQYDRNLYAQAARAFAMLIRLKPNDGTAHVMLGLSQFELGKDTLALNHIEKGKQVGINNDPQLRKVVLYHEAVLLQRASKFEGAQQTLEQMCLEGVRSEDINRTLGMVLLRMPNRNAPAAGSREADVVQRIGQAECLAGAKNYDQARKDFKALLEEYPDYPNLHYAFGMFLLEARDTPAAIKEFKQEIARTPDHVFARLQIAAANYKVDSAAGLPYAEEAVKLNPRLPFGHYLLGLLRLDTDDYRGAISELEVAKKFFPRESKLYFALGSAYARAGREQDAKRARETFARLQQEEQGRGEGKQSLTVR
jgi:tetratricopeptide (TPR) repeat protein